VLTALVPPPMHHLPTHHPGDGPAIAYMAMFMMVAVIGAVLLVTMWREGPADPPTGFEPGPGWDPDPLPPDPDPGGIALPTHPLFDDWDEAFRRLTEKEEVGSGV
jgi:hypothetical protein